MGKDKVKGKQDDKKADVKVEPTVDNKSEPKKDDKNAKKKK